ncbi:hypothetical protein ABID37_001073 [Aquamicrobium terrae]|uniref:Uncharacterized protein n=1 Tax=Aquamicrobium terrae TaxID=1324945 RepID=A0ABV2MVN4_9HYPH
MMQHAEPPLAILLRPPEYARAGRHGCGAAMQLTVTFRNKARNQA